MLFNSVEYVFIFLPIIIIIYYLINYYKLNSISKVWLGLNSLFFYGYWNPKYLILIIASVTVNFTIGLWLTKYKSNRIFILVVGITFNIGILGYFKYIDFFINNINTLTGSNIELIGIVLPLAVSFFTFQQIAYLVDCYHKKVTEHNLVNYSLFVTFFPQLIAGPIVHHKEMMPQFSSPTSGAINYNNIALGILFFTTGLFKKVFIADTFAIWATAGFDHAENLSFFDAWGVSLSYTFQLYYDFSGYADMAIGSALLFNIYLPFNFNSPYKALSITDFWRRWHMTLSRWLKDYLYIPLGGNRVSKWRTHINILLTMLLGGLWHGASWNFVIWGGVHSVGLVINRIWLKMGIPLPSFFCWLITFLFVNFSWVLFRAKNLDDTIKIYKGMLGFNGMSVSERFADTADYILGIPLQRFISNEYTYTTSMVTIKWLVVFSTVAFFSSNTQEIFFSKKSVFSFFRLIFSILSIMYFYFFSIRNFPSEFLYFIF